MESLGALSSFTVLGAKLEADFNGEYPGSRCPHLRRNPTCAVLCFAHGDLHVAVQAAHSRQCTAGF